MSLSRGPSREEIRQRIVAELDRLDRPTPVMVGADMLFVVALVGLVVMELTGWAPAPLVFVTGFVALALSDTGRRLALWLVRR
jgi:hypothetical protein